MIKNMKSNQLIEYLPLIFILSYFVFHHILLVLIGITYSLYLINNDLINSLIKSLKKNLINFKEFKYSTINDKEIKSEYININSYGSDSKSTLVETIEELGFIPSIDKNEKDKDV
tara:strand:+ start:2882 stop:3226 length:345 start_codon:yes stop_codon:yes gene_type:complete